MSRHALGIVLTCLSLACAAEPNATEASEPTTTVAADVHVCEGPRPEMCTAHYDPVCAQRDTGIRCVKAPCNAAAEPREYSNACAACQDPKVHSYTPGPC
jgi:hypothetical protein